MDQSEGEKPKAATPVSSPSRREAARREQARRDTKYNKKEPERIALRLF